MVINFFNEDIDFQLSNKKEVSLWLEKIAISHEKKIVSLNYIFCSDKYLLKLNQSYLNSDYYTDIITFDNSDTSENIEGDIFISINRVRYNSETISVSFQMELKRVIVHGLLHLLSYNDETETEKKQMREKEKTCLSLLKG